jgi:hypothetical protein
MDGALTDYDKFMDVLMSQEAVTAIYADDALMSRLFGSAWIAESRTWKRPQGLGATLRQFVNKVFGLPAWVQPGIDPVVGLLQSRLRILRNDVGSSHTVIMHAESPDLASMVLSSVMSTADGILRDRARAANSGNVSFLRRQLGGEVIIEVRTELSRQLAEALSRNAVLESSAPYAYEMLKNYRVSAAPVAPRPILSLFLACLAGLIVGAVLAILRAANWLRVAPRR